MRYFIPLLLVLAALWYFTSGVRVGMVTFTPTTMFNANGKSNYKIRAFEDKQQVSVTGNCDVKSGVANIRLYSPRGEQVAGQACERVNSQGKWSINVAGRGTAGFYRLAVEYKNFSGRLELNQAVATVR